MLEFRLGHEEATVSLGQSIARLLTRGDVLALHGDLGVGKTTLSRGLIQTLAGPEIEVQSPTYTLVHSYPTPIGELHHIDLYRLEAPGDVFDLAWDDLLHDTIIVEWPDRAGPHLPQDRLDLTLTMDGGDRHATLCPQSEAWQEKLATLEFSP